VAKESLSMVGPRRIAASNLSMAVETSNFDSDKCVHFLKDVLIEFGGHSAEPEFSKRLDKWWLTRNESGNISRAAIRSSHPGEAFGVYLARLEAIWLEGKIKPDVYQRLKAEWETKRDEANRQLFPNRED